MAKILEPWRKKQPITAVRLNEFSESINNLNREVFSTPDQNEPPPETKKSAAEEATDVVASDVYVESSRSTSSVQVYDQNETNYAEIERIDSITFTNDEGKSLTLQFNN